MAEDSAQLLGWLRKLIKDKGLNNAAIAEKIGATRGHVRKILTGAEPMMVDELMKLSAALELRPGDMGLAAPEEASGTDAESDEVDETLAAEASKELYLDPWGNHPEQLIRAGFMLGCNFYFLIKTSELGADSGLPASVLNQHKDRDLPVQLDAAYHAYNDPKYDEGGVEMTLSFDALYDVYFPWPAFKQVSFFPVAPESVIAPEPEPEPKEEPKKAPFLRLVK